MKCLLFGTALCVIFIPTPALADASLEHKVQRLEQLLGELQGRLDEQDRVIARKDQTVQQQDTVTVTIAPPYGSWFVTAGQFYIPFGVSETNMISYPITLEIGETRESSLPVGFKKDQFSGNI